MSDEPKRCETCDHWSSNTRSHNFPKEVRLCNKIKDSSFQDDNQNTCTWGPNGSVLMTHKNFSCLLWEPKSE